MKMRRHLLCTASLAVCALLLLSACQSGASIAGRVSTRAAETVTPAAGPGAPASSGTVVPSTAPPSSPGSPPAGVSPSPAATATEAAPTPDRTPPSTDTATPTGTPFSPTGTPTPPPTETPPPSATQTGTPTPPPLATDTPPVPKDVKPARPTATETPAVLNIKPPEISRYSLQQGSDGGWVYKDKSGKEVAHTVTYSWEGLNWKKTMQKGAIVVSDEKLMADLLRTANKGRGTTELPLFPLFINPEGLELREIKNMKDHIVIAVYGQIKQVVQPFPGVSPTLRNDFGSFEVIAFSPTNAGSLKFYAADFESPLKPFLQTVKPFLAPLAYNFSDDLLPESFEVPGASGLMTVGSSIGGKSLTLDNFLSLGNFTVVAG